MKPQMQHVNSRQVRAIENECTKREGDKITGIYLSHFHLTSHTTEALCEMLAYEALFSIAFRISSADFRRSCMRPPTNRHTARSTPSTRLFGLKKCCMEAVADHRKLSACIRIVMPSGSLSAL